MVPKKGLEPPHPCGYMDLNHARLPIPPLRQVTACGAARAALMEETATSILQVERGVSNQRPRNLNYEDREGGMARKAGAEAAKRGTAPVSARPGAKIDPKKDKISRLRTLAHDLSNALEGILQASYLLSQSKLEDDPKRWAQLIDASSQEAARLNREIRQWLRLLSEE